MKRTKTRKSLSDQEEARRFENKGKQVHCVVSTMIRIPL